MHNTKTLKRFKTEIKIKPCIVLFFFCLIGAGAAAAQNRNPEDESLFFEGPHLFYSKDNVVVYRGTKGPNGMEIQKETLPRDQLTSVLVEKSGLDPVSFQVPLRAQHPVPESTYPAADKLFLFSDIEGNFNTMTGLLQKHGVIDECYHWSFASGHLAILGDVFDRGNHVTECLWLIYRLEQEARDAGGQVHFVIGNHDAMNMYSDWRYLEPKYELFHQLMEDEGLEPHELFGPRTELGRWLSSHNTVHKVGDLLLVHGGVSPYLVMENLALENLNGLMRAGYHILKPNRSEQQQLLFGAKGPLWYRGYFMEWSGVPQITSPQLDQVLEFYSVRKVVVGHTILDQPGSLWDGRVIAIDVKHPMDGYPADPPYRSYAVLIESGQVWVADEDGQKHLIKHTEFEP